MDEKLELVANAAFPMYHLVGSRSAMDEPENELYAGRVVHLWPVTPMTPAIFANGVGDRDALLDSLTGDDVLWVPIYDCHIDQRIEHWPGGKPAEWYEGAFALLMDAAPIVRAVMIGNMGPEMCFFDRSKRYNPSAHRFVRDTALLIRDCGGRPAYGTVDWDLLIDCYMGGGQMADAMREVNALQVCYCGYTMLPGAYYDRSHNLYAEQSGFIAAHDKDVDGVQRPKLRQYLSKLDVVTGVNFINGLKAGNDKLAAEYGFSAGMIG